MSYEKEAVVTPSAAPSPTSPIMKEERVVESYSNPNRVEEARARVVDKSDQPNISKGSADTQPAEDTVKLSPQIAALARKEQKFRQREQQQKQKEEEFKAKTERLSKYESLEDKLAKDDYSDVENIVNYDKYTNYLLNKDSNLTPEQIALKKLENEVEGMKKNNVENVNKQFEAAVQFRRNAVVQLVDSNKEFNTLKKAGPKAAEAVVQHILDTWENDEVDLSPEQAAKEVQATIVAKARKWADILNGDTLESSPGNKKQLPPLKSGTKTITNNMTTQGEVKRTLKSFQNMTESERYEEARKRAEERISKGIR